MGKRDPSIHEDKEGSRGSRVSFVAVSLVFIGLTVHTVYITMYGAGLDVRRELRVGDVHLTRVARGNSTHRITRDGINTVSVGSEDGKTYLSKAQAPSSWPELFIFRRTKKTGSSSMMNALMDALQPLGYHALPHTLYDELEFAIRHEFQKPHPRRIMVLHHNAATRNMHPQRRAIIADTLRDGFKHVTSYCRFMKGVRTCEDDMIFCLKSNVTLRQLHYRWAGRPTEDTDTYIDLPISSSHPALSTTVMRTVFPDITLSIDRYNVRDTACAPDGPAKIVYDELYSSLDKQVDNLRKRLLVIAGYPYLMASDAGANATLSEMLDAADKLEQQKYDIPHEQATPKGKSPQVKNLLSQLDAWGHDDNGSLILKKRRPT